MVGVRPPPPWLQAAAALATLGEFDRAQGFAEQGLGLKRRDEDEDDPQLRQVGWRTDTASTMLPPTAPWTSLVTG